MSPASGSMLSGEPASTSPSACLSAYCDLCLSNKVIKSLRNHFTSMYKKFTLGKWIFLLCPIHQHIVYNLIVIWIWWKKPRKQCLLLGEKERQPHLGNTLVLFFFGLMAKRLTDWDFLRHIWKDIKNVPISTLVVLFKINSRRGAWKLSSFSTGLPVKSCSQDAMIQSHVGGPSSGRTCSFSLPLPFPPDCAFSLSLSLSLSEK